MLMDAPNTTHASVLTLGLALAWIATAPLTDTQKRDLRSAVLTSCRWIGKSPDEVSGDPAVVRRLFKDISPGGAGVTRKTFSTVKSAVNRLLKLMGVVPRPIHKWPLSPKWQSSLRLIGDEQVRYSIKRFGRFCTSRGVEPEDVCEEIAGAFRGALELELRVAAPRSAHRQTLDRWNRLAKSIPGWPQTILAVPNYSRGYALPWNAFHCEYASDVERYLARRITIDPFDLSAPIRPLRESSAATYRKNFRLFASCLVHTGVDPTQIRSLADVVQLKTVQRGLRYLVQERKAKLLASEIAKLLAVVAKDYVGAPATDVAAIKGIAARLRGQRRGLCETIRERLSPLKHEPNLAKLFLLPIGLIRGLIRKPGTSVADARLFQCALALALLTVCPLRIGALCSIRLDRHLSWSAAPTKGDLIIEFAPGELKGDEAGSFPIPRDVTRLIRVYWERFRPLLNPRGSPFLFCGLFPEQPRSKTGFSAQLSQLVFDRLGLRVNPHLYRHLVHLVVLRRFPAAYAMVARVLTHRSINTTIQNYSYLDGEIAMRAYQQMVEGVKGGSSHWHEAGPRVVAYALDRDEGRHHVRT